MIVNHNFHITQLGRDRKVRVYLPPSYHRKERKYPVIYMHDGQNLFDTQSAFGRPWYVDRIIDKMPIRRHAVVVGIDNGEMERLKEYSAFSRENHVAEGGAYLKFITENLKPFIDQNYRTHPTPEHTWMVGSSMGGLITHYAGMNYPDVFGKVGIFSPSIWFNPEITYYEPPKPLTNNSFYVVGSRTESRAMEGDLKNVYWSFKKSAVPDTNLRVIVRDKGRHNEAFWAREFKKLMLEWTK